MEISKGNCMEGISNFQVLCAICCHRLEQFFGHFEIAQVCIRLRQSIKRSFIEGKQHEHQFEMVYCLFFNLKVETPLNFFP